MSCRDRITSAAKWLYTTITNVHTAARSNWIHVDFVKCLIISAVRLPKATRSMPTRCVGIQSPQIASAFSHDGACIIDHIHTHTHTEKLLSSQNDGRRDVRVFIFFFFFFCGVVCWYNNFVVLFLFLCLAIRPRAETNRPLMKTKDVTDYSGRLIRTSSASQAFWLVIPARTTHQQFSDDDGGLQMLIAQRQNNI